MARTLPHGPASGPGPPSGWGNSWTSRMLPTPAVGADGPKCTAPDGVPSKSSVGDAGNLLAAKVMLPPVVALRPSEVSSKSLNAASQVAVMLTFLALTHRLSSSRQPSGSSTEALP